MQGRNAGVRATPCPPPCLPPERRRSSGKIVIRRVSRQVGGRRTHGSLSQGPSDSPAPAAGADVPAAVNKSALPSLQILPLRLHSCHVESADNRPLPISSDDLTAFLSGGTGRSRNNRKFRVAISDGSMLVILDEQSGKASQSVVEVRLFLTELEVGLCGADGLPLLGLRTVLQNDSKRALAAQSSSLAPNPAATPRRGLHHSGVPCREPAWLFVADVGDGSLQQALKALSAAGAVRTDFDIAYDMEGEVLGLGGFAVVKRARARSHSGMNKPQPVAVKCITPDAGFTRKTSPGQMCQVMTADSNDPDPQTCIPKILRSEIQFLFLARGHPHVITLHSVFRQPLGGWSLVMDYCSGGDAYALVSKLGKLPEAACCMLVGGLLDALMHIHGLDILHRDVKPENVFIHTDGRPVLADFGLACRGNDSEETRRRIGSPGYIAPEVLRGGRCTGKADTFGAGMTLHFALSGTMPFSGRDMAATLHKTLTETIVYCDELYGHLSAASKQLAMKLQSKRPEERPTAAEARADDWFSRIGKPASTPKGSTEGAVSPVWTDSVASKPEKLTSTPPSRSSSASGGRPFSGRRLSSNMVTGTTDGEAEALPEKSGAVHSNPSLTTRAVRPTSAGAGSRRRSVSFQATGAIKLKKPHALEPVRRSTMEGG
eukprot:TRINITY_DN61507_c0_g1_i1.p1 TRINITY_DN61507_c0_g1~~TRINITY_DN61507_c0_g1_i1.p1  ORF type:complete len:659 (-),score=80.52 TRINITY_DN61507_c0_g1_i1:279-2255(-)